MIGCKLARIWLSLMVLAVASTPAWALSANRINDVRLKEFKQGIVVEIAGERAPNFTTFKQDTPRRVIVDVAECALNGVPAQISGDGSLVGSISTQQYGQAPHGISRVVIQLLREAEYRVTIRGGSLFVHLSPGTGGLLVSAGVPIGPNRKPAAKPVKVEPRDRALSEELSQPAPQEAEVEDAGPAVVANSIPEPNYVNISDPQPEPESDSAGAPPPPVDESAKPIRVAMATLPPEPAPPPEPIKVVQAEESEPAPVEVVEEVEEVPEEAVPEVPLPPPGADAAGMAAEEAVPMPPPEDDIPPPPEEVVPPPPPPEEAVPMPPPPEETAPPPPPPDTYASEGEERVEISSAVKHMTWLGFQQTSNASRVFIKTNEPVEYRTSEEGDNLVVLELENTTIPLRNNRRFLDTHFFDSAITLITPREIHGVGRNVRVEIQIKRRVPYRVGREDNLVSINFERPQ